MAIIGTIAKATQAHGAITPHDVYYTRLKSEATHRLATITQEPLAADREKVLCQLIEALEHGETEHQAEAIMVVAEWLHACHELHEHRPLAS